MITLRNITVMKSGAPLLEQLDWTVRDGEHWLISGENGSGKTTLLETVAGLLVPVKGEIGYSFVSGEDWDERYEQRKRNILYIPAHAGSAFLANHEVFYQQRYYTLGDEQIPLVKDLMGPAFRRLQSLHLPDSFSIDNLLDLPVTRLSNGQMKKVLILRKMISHTPRLLLMDYPFEGLDYESREDFIRFLDHLVSEHNVQLMLADHHHHLPRAINRRLEMEALHVQRMEEVFFADAKPPHVAGTNPPASHTETVVEMKNVAVRYGSTTILDGFSWKINRGERWALTGRNGSGKTTLFSMIYADHPMAYSQQVYLFGKRRGTGESIWDIKRRINYLGPELLSYLNPGDLFITGFEYIRLSRNGVDPQQLETVATFFDAHAMLTRPVRTLSSGHLQLLMIITSLLSGRELLLLDEPFQFLDLNNKAKLNDFLHQRLNPDTTMILITHYEEDVRTWTQWHRRLG